MKIPTLVSASIGIFAISLSGCAGQGSSFKSIADEKSKWLRGQSGNSCYYVMNANSRQKLIAYVKNLKAGTQIRDILSELGPPDEDNQDFESPFSPVTGRMLTYYCLIYKRNNVMSKIDQVLFLSFDPDLKNYKSFGFSNIVELGGSSYQLPSSL